MSFLAGIHGTQQLAAADARPAELARRVPLIQVRERAARMLRISAIADSDEQVTLLLEGRVTPAETDALTAACRDALGRGRQLSLDLSGVSFIDTEGIALFHDLQDQGVKLIRCSGFIAEQLRRRVGSRREQEGKDN